MSYAAHLVVRAKDGKYFGGFASEYPLSAGYKDIADGNYCGWYGCQMQYKPFLSAFEDCLAHANKLNGNGGNY